MYEKEGNSKMAQRFAGFDWKTEEDAFNDGFRRAGQKDAPKIDSQGGDTGHLVTYERLLAAGNNGVQLPVQAYADGKLKGTEMLYTDGKFDTADGKAHFKPAQWKGLPEPVVAQKKIYKFWLNNGRNNEIWQTAYHDQYNSFAQDRYPMAYIEINPADCQDLGVEASDVVEVYNDYGSTYAMVYPVPEIKRGQTFMMFGYVNGIKATSRPNGPTATSFLTTKAPGGISGKLAPSRSSGTPSVSRAADSPWADFQQKEHCPSCVSPSCSCRLGWHPPA